MLRFTGRRGQSKEPPASLTYCAVCSRPIGRGDQVLELRFGRPQGGVAVSAEGLPVEAVFVHASLAPDGINCLTINGLEKAVRRTGAHPAIERSDQDRDLEEHNGVKPTLGGGGRVILLSEHRPGSGPNRPASQ